MTTRFSSLLIVFALFIATMPVCAQRQIEQSIVDKYLAEAGDHAALYYAPLEEPWSATQWINHPFWETEEPSMGDVCFDGIVYRNVTMRFNVVSQQLVVATAEGKVFVAPDMTKVEYFVMRGKKFCKNIEKQTSEIQSTNFWCLDYSDEYRQLWEERTKVKGPDEIYNGRSLSAYMENVRYMVTDGNRSFLVKKPKDIAKQYPQHRKQIKKYIRSLNMVVSEDKLPAIISTLQYLNMLE